MRITAFHVDHFGILRDVTVDGLDPGLTVFLGNNEAGKSTCLDFLRVMLTGYASRRTTEGKERDYASGPASRGGGTLHLDTAHGLIRLLRRPGPHGGQLSLSDGHGNPLDVSLLDKLMGGVTREIFRNVYGFSLNELQHLRSLSSPEVRNALYGASFGLGLRSPGAAQKRLEQAMEALYRPQGSKQPLAESLRHWEELRKNIRDAEAEAGRYDELAEQLQAVEESLNALRHERSSAQQALRDVERRLGVWQLWEEWRLAGQRLERLEPVPETFPPDGLSRLERAEERRAEAERQSRLIHEKMDRIAAERDASTPDDVLLEAGEALQRLAERRASCRNAMAEIPRISMELRRAESELTAQLNWLGPEWTLERIRAVDRSLFAREALEQQAQAMHLSENAVTAERSAADKAERDLHEARHAEALARRTLETLPVPPLALDQRAREQLAKSLARTEDAQEKMPERLLAQERATAAFSHALARLHLPPGEASIHTLDRLIAAQDTALRKAEAVRQAKLKAGQAAMLAGQAREAEKLAQQRLSRLLNEQGEAGGLTRATLETRRDTLRRLRKQSAELDREQNRAAEVRAGLESHLQAVPRQRVQPQFLIGGGLLVVSGLYVLMAAGQAVPQRPAPLLPPSTGALLACIGVGFFLAGLLPETRRKGLLILGGLGCLCGGAALAARLLFGLHGLTLPSGDLLPLELWSGYLTLLAGVLCLGVANGAGFGRRGGEVAPRTLITIQWEQRLAAAEAAIRSLQEEIQVLCDSLGLPACEPEALDALEADLDAQRERWAANVRMQQEVQAHNQDIDELRRRIQDLEADAAAKAAHERTMQREWHAYLIDLGLREELPTPEGAERFFMQIDNARRDWSALAAMQSELESMEACGLDLMRLARDLLPSQAQPESWSSLTGVMHAVRQALEACREADVAAQNRARAEESLHAAQAQLTRAEHVRDDAVRALDAAETRLREAQESWRACLADIGFSQGLTPATTRDALEYMNRCLDIESAISRLRGDMERQCQERDAFVLPLRDLLEHLDRLPRMDPGGDPDWLGCHEAAVQAWEEHARLAESRRGHEQALAALAEDAHATHEAARDASAQLAALLDLAGVDDPEAFRRLENVRREREALTRRKEDLEDTLRQSAGDQPLEDYLREFASLDRDHLEQCQAELLEAIEAVACQEEACADSAGNLRAQLGHLTSSDSLSQLRQQEAAVREELRLLGLEWSHHALASHLITEARKRFEQERQPEVIRAAATLFSAITDQAWTGINASLEDGQLLVLPPHGEPVPPEQLSRGTQEQLYLALRLAHIRQHAALTTPLPVIMDDILVNFDPDRAARTAQALMDLTLETADGPGHQVLYFTCHPQTVALFRAQAPKCRVLRIEKGRLTEH